MCEAELHELTSCELLPLIGELRVRAWGTELWTPPNLSQWIDDYDYYARHWVFMCGGQPVAAARLTVHATLDDLPDAEVYSGVFNDKLPSPIASLNRLVVDPMHRNRGYGSTLDLIRLEAAISEGCKAIVGSSSADRRIHQLQRQGFSIGGSKNRNNQPIFQGRGIQTVLFRFL